MTTNDVPGTVEHSNVGGKSKMPIIELFILYLDSFVCHITHIILLYFRNFDTRLPLQQNQTLIL